MWKYSQGSGQLFRGDDPEPVSTGYSGSGTGKDNPALQNVANVGPIPQGMYVIGAAHTHPELGPIVMNLTPTLATNTFGRSEFRIHGDSIGNPGAASHGCIILPRSIRDWIATSGDAEMEVVA